MKCNQISDKLTMFIKREVNADDRISIRQHLRECPSCRHEYHKYLNLYYTLDYQIVNPEPVPKSNIFPLVNSKDRAGPNYQLRWLGAAAIIIVLAISAIMINKYSQPKQIISQSVSSVEQQLAGADWMNLAQSLQNNEFLRQNADRTIQTDMLLAKLNELEQNGVKTLAITGNSTDPLTREVKLDAFIKKLEKYQRYKPIISIREISDFINII